MAYQIHTDVKYPPLVKVEAGALADAFQPADGALLVFRAEGPADVERFVREDPYVQNGLVTSWRIREWTVVVGAPAP